MMTRRVCLGVLAVSGLGLVGACLPDNPAVDDTGSDTESTTGDMTGGDDGTPGGALLGCPDGCTMLMVVQTLDDRIEVFVPDEAEPYRGAIDLDLDPNDDGDIGNGRLDEPFGLVQAGGYLHVLAGHYPEREAGSLLSFPLTVFEGVPMGGTLPVGDYFMGGQFLDPVLGRALGEREAIFLHHHDSGRVLVGVFNNDLFAAEDTWTQSGKLLVFDPSDPAGEIGTVVLDGLMGGTCQGAAQVVDLGGGTIGVACDGNEAVALLDGSAIGTGSVADAAASLGNGMLCDIQTTPATGRRVRYLAPDGAGGVVVGEGPGIDLQGDASLWHFDASCNLAGVADLPAPDLPLAEVIALPGSIPTWLVAAGAASAGGARGIYVAHESGGTLEVCGDPIAGFADHWGFGDTLIDPYALALTLDGGTANLAVGAGPLIADQAGVGYGKVLWASLSGADPCSLSADVVDLTDGGPGHAPAPTPNDPSTFRRGPNVVVIQEISGA